MDLRKGISIRIEGEQTKNKTIPLDVLVKLATNLQELILEVAKLNLHDEKVIKLDNFKIELSGFKGGSAVPQFVFTRVDQSLLGVDIDKQQKQVSDKLAKIISISSTGHFTELKDEFPQPEGRNAVIKSLYGFINSVGNAPLSIVRDDMTPEYKIQRLSKQAMESLCVEIDKTTIEETSNLSVIKLAKIEMKGEKGRKKILQTYDEKVKATFDPEIINCRDYQYILKSPLRSSFTEIEGNFVIENELLGIYAYGKNIDEAELMFAMEFDYIYNRYNELEESKLSDEVKFIKIYLNQIVKSRG